MDRLGIPLRLYMSMQEQMWARLGKSMFTVWLLVAPRRTKQGDDNRFTD